MPEVVRGAEADERGVEFPHDAVLGALFERKREVGSKSSSPLAGVGQPRAFDPEPSQVVISGLVEVGDSYREVVKLHRADAEGALGHAAQSRNAALAWDT